MHKDVSAVAAWDSSIHDSVHLNKVTDRKYTLESTSFRSHSVLDMVKPYTAHHTQEDKRFLLFSETEHLYFSNKSELIEFYSHLCKKNHLFVESNLISV